MGSSQLAACGEVPLCLGKEPAWVDGVLGLSPDHGRVDVGQPRVANGICLKGEPLGCRSQSGSPMSMPRFPSPQLFQATMMTQASFLPPGEDLHPDQERRSIGMLGVCYLSRKGLRNLRAGLFVD